MWLLQQELPGQCPQLCHPAAQDTGTAVGRNVCDPTYWSGGEGGMERGQEGDGRTEKRKGERKNITLKAEYVVICFCGEVTSSSSDYLVHILAKWNVQS